ncbi:2-dehydro-3-deoxygalactonokinase [soil metagenome]
MSHPSDRILSADWGTSRLRLQLVRSDPFTVLAEVSADLGIARVFDAWQAAGSPEDREGFFLRALAPEVDRLQSDLPGVPMVISGMASSTIGLRELPYAPVPFHLAGEALPIARIPPRILPCETVLVSGVCSEDDIMRGEETILLGLAEMGVGDGLYLLPGTHSKHVEVQDRVLKRFRTYLTGEMFALLRDHSVLRSCLQANSAPNEAFLEGVREAASGANLLREAFALRARSVLHKTPPEAIGQRLSGLLIGAELRDLIPVVADGRPIHLAASEPLLGSYQEALRCLGLAEQVRPIPPAELARAVILGHHQILDSIFKQQLPETAF